MKWQVRKEQSPPFKLMRRLESDLMAEYERTRGASFTYILILKDLEMIYNMITAVYSENKISNDIQKDSNQCG